MNDLVLDSLPELEASIKGNLTTFERGTMEAAEARLAIGRDLAQARRHFSSNNLLGDWCEERFGARLKSRQWRNVLMEAAENEESVRSALTTQVVNGEEINFKTAVLKASGKSPQKPKQQKKSPVEPAFHICPNCGSQVECKASV